MRVCRWLLRGRRPDMLMTFHTVRFAAKSLQTIENAEVMASQKCKPRTI